MLSKGVFITRCQKRRTSAIDIGSFKLGSLCRLAAVVSVPPRAIRGRDHEYQSQEYVAAEIIIHTRHLAKRYTMGFKKATTSAAAVLFPSAYWPQKDNRIIHFGLEADPRRGAARSYCRGSRAPRGDVRQQIRALITVQDRRPIEPIDSGASRTLDRHQRRASGTRGRMGHD